MGQLTFWGFAIFAFGPSFALFFNVIANRSQLVILAVTSALLCVVALVASGFFWWAIGAVQEEDGLAVAFGVVFVELFRLLFVKVYEKGERNVEELVNQGGQTHRSPFLDFSSGISGGLGFGMAYSLVFYGGVLEASLLQGDLYTDSCPQVSGFVISALLAFLYQVLHVCLMLLMIDGIRKNESKQRIARYVEVFLLHLAASLFGLINQSSSMGGCKVGVPLQYTVLLVTILETIRVVRNPKYGNNVTID